MKEVKSYSFSIEMPNGSWKNSPEYPTPEKCFEAACRCTKHLGKKFQRITFVTNSKWVAE